MMSESENIILTLSKVTGQHSEIHKGQSTQNWKIHSHIIAPHMIRL